MLPKFLFFNSARFILVIFFAVLSGIAFSDDRVEYYYFDPVSYRIQNVHQVVGSSPGEVCGNYGGMPGYGARYDSSSAVYNESSESWECELTVTDKFGNVTKTSVAVQQQCTTNSGADILGFSGFSYAGTTANKFYQLAGNPVFSPHKCYCAASSSYSSGSQACVKGRDPVNNGRSCNNTPNPINIATGNKYYELKNNFDGIPFNYYYNSNSGLWTFSYQQYLDVESDYVYYHGEDGKLIRFYLDAKGEYFSVGSRKERLERSGSGFILSFSDNKKELFDPDGRLISIVPLVGERVMVEYQANKVLVKRAGHTLTMIKPDPSILILREIDVRGQKYVVSAKHSHNTRQLDSVVLPDGSVKQFYYDYLSDVGPKKRKNSFSPILNHPILRRVEGEFGFDYAFLYEDAVFATYVTGILDKSGRRVSTVVYDNLGRAVSSERGRLGSGVERFEVQYNDDGTVTVTNPLGKKSTYWFDDFEGAKKVTKVEGHASDHCAGANKQYRYDNNGFLAEKTDWNGVVTKFESNNKGQEVLRVEAYGTLDERKKVIKWHPDFDLPVEVVDEKTITKMTYDRNGRLLSKVVKQVGAE